MTKRKPPRKDLAAQAPEAAAFGDSVESSPACCLDPKKIGKVIYPLVNVYITMENHDVEWVNQLFLWPFSVAMLVYQRVPLL